MEIRLQAEYQPTERYGPRVPGLVSVQLYTIAEGWTEVLSLQSETVPGGVRPWTKEDIIVDTLKEFFLGLQELTDRTDAIIGIADDSR